MLLQPSRNTDSSDPVLCQPTLLFSWMEWHTLVSKRIKMLTRDFCGQCRRDISFRLTRKSIGNSIVSGILVLNSTLFIPYTFSFVLSGCLAKLSRLCREVWYTKGSNDGLRLFPSRIWSDNSFSPRPLVYYSSITHIVTNIAIILHTP